MVAYIIAIIAIAFAFDFINGFHDSANSIAAIVGTRVLSPLQAVVWAAFFNFAAAFTVSTAVAKAVASGFIDVRVIDANVVLGALLGAIVWNLITWYYGLPSSSSHALIGGFAGAAVAKAGLSAITWGEKWVTTLSFIAVSPVVGMVLSSGLMILMAWIFRWTNPHRVNRFFRHAQLVGSASLSLAHGANDAQKTMGIIMGLLVATQKFFVDQTGVLRHLHVTSFDAIPYWIEIGAYTAIAMGTLFGGWRIVHTMGSRVTRLRPVGGFCADTGGAMSILLATRFGIPVSTTHTITGAIVGVGAVIRVRAVRWDVAGRIVWAWVMTIPAAAVMAGVSYFVLAALIKL